MCDGKGKTPLLAFISEESAGGLFIMKNKVVALSEIDSSLAHSHPKIICNQAAAQGRKAVGPGLRQRR